MHNSLHFPNCDLDIHLCGKVAKQIEMSLEDCVRRRHPECSYQVGFQDKGKRTWRRTCVTKGKVGRGVFGDWRVAPFASLSLARMK